MGETSFLSRRVVHKIMRKVRSMGKEDFDIPKLLATSLFLQTHFCSFLLLLPSAELHIKVSFLGCLMLFSYEKAGVFQVSWWARSQMFIRKKDRLKWPVHSRVRRVGPSLVLLTAMGNYAKQYINRKQKTLSGVVGTTVSSVFKK